MAKTPRTTVSARISESTDLLHIEFADNPQPRCPCVLLLDGSASMQGEPIDELNRALRLFAEDIRSDSLAAQRVEVAVIRFAYDAELIQDFVTADDFTPPEIVADGLTAMGAGLELALDALEHRKREYRQNGIAYFRPWLFLLTDGEPQGEHPDATAAAFRRAREAEANKQVQLFAIGTGDANMKVLARLSGRPPQKVDVTRFADLFEWLSRSVQLVSNSRPGDQVPLAPLTWAIASS